MMLRPKQQARNKKLCPFDTNHVVEPRAYPTHLIKCKSPNRVNFVQCAFNNLHYVLTHLKKEHQMNCESRQKFAPQQEQKEVVEVHPVQDVVILPPPPQEQPMVKQQYDPDKVSDDGLDEKCLSDCSSCRDFFNDSQNQEIIKTNSRLVKLLKKYDQKKKKQKLLALDQSDVEITGVKKSKKITK